MPRLIASSLVVPRVVALAALLAAGPALAQAQAPAGPGGPAKASRSVSTTGRTMPPPRNAGQAAQPKPASEVEMVKAQKAAEARSKAWDTKMHKTMSTICHGC